MAGERHSQVNVEAHSWCVGVSYNTAHLAIGTDKGVIIGDPRSMAKPTKLTVGYGQIDL